MKQLETQQPPAAAPAPKPAPAPRKAQASQTYMNTNLVVISAPESTSPETYDKLSQAVEKKWREILSSEAQVYQPLPASVTGKISGTGAAAALLLQNESEQNAMSQARQTSPGYAPLLGPPPPITAAQQKQLNDLLVLYEADRLTPEQYHDRRAKILGEH